MKSEMAPNILLAIVFVAAAGAVALRAAAMRPEPQAVPATGHGMARPPAPPGRPAITVEQAQHIFHELHAEGRNALCAVCDIQYASG
jgi:hypothetical protein